MKAVKTYKPNPIVESSFADNGDPYSSPGVTSKLTRGEEDTLLKLLRERLDSREILYFESLLLLKIVRARAERRRFDDRYPAGNPAPVKMNATARKLLAKKEGDGACPSSAV